MGTTTLGIPYPESTDLVKDGATDMQALAEAANDLYGLVHINETAIGSGVNTVTLSNIFSADYDTYQIQINGGVASSANYVFLRLGLNGTPETASNYRSSFIGVTYATSATVNAGSGATSQISYAGRADTSRIDLNVKIASPFLAKQTMFYGQFDLDNLHGCHCVGSHALSTSYNDLIIGGTSGITFTGGTIRVYGYRN